MKETITRYYCDRCGSEFRPYGHVGNITPGYGVVAFRKQYSDVTQQVFAGVADWTPNASDSSCAMVLCKKCLDGLALYLMNE